MSFWERLIVTLDKSLLGNFSTGAGVVRSGKSFQRIVKEGGRNVKNKLLLPLPLTSSKIQN